jgi:peptide methionine sulfoxide reductase MsrB
MTKKFKLPVGVDENGQLIDELGTPDTKLRHFRNVTAVLMRDALDVWADMWEELHGRVTCGAAVLPEAEKGFKPKCGWPEFLEKMWLLKHYLDYTKRFSEGSR